MASFKSAKDAKAFARVFCEAKPTGEGGKPLGIRPQLPPSVIASQGALQRAMHALKASRSNEAPKTHVWCDFKKRVVTDGNVFFARQWINGAVTFIPETVTDPGQQAPGSSKLIDF